MNVIERVVNDLNVAKLILCNPQMLTPEMCIRIGQAITSAIAILKEQEAVLLTFEEVKNHFHVPIKLLGDIEKYVDFENDIEPLYLECDIEDAWTVHWRTYDNTKEYLESWGKDYGKTWRCWTKKPTEEQKMAVKWE